MRGFTPQLVRVLSSVADDRGDGELLDGFITRQADEDFARLVRKYGPMVWGVCRRALPDLADAEDAFQTVFLVLVQRGRKLTGHANIGPWLHRVAVWTTRNARRRNARRQGKPATLLDAIPALSADHDLALDLDAALLSLPDKLRSSIILCHVLGLSRADAAARLGCAERTLSSWLSLGLARLRRKLSGLDPARALGVAAIAAPVALSDAVVRAAISVRTTAVVASVVSSTVSQFIEGVMRMFWVKKATAACMALATVFAFGVGVGVSTHQLGLAAGGDEPGKGGNPPTPAKSARVLEPTVDELAKAEELYDQVVLEFRNLKEQEADAQKELTDDLLKLAREQARTPEAFQKLNEKGKQLQRLEAQLSSAKEKMGTLRARILALRALKSQQAKGEPQKPGEKTPTTTPSGPEDFDKRLKELEWQLRKLQVEMERAHVEAAQMQAKEQEMRAKLEAIRAARDLVQKEKEKLRASGAKEQAAGNPTGAYLQLIISGKLNPPGKDSVFPYQLKEFGPDGKLIGTVGCDNAEVLGRYLTRTRKDASGPKDLRIAIREGGQKEEILAAMDAVKASGYKVSRLDLVREGAELNELEQLRLRAMEAEEAARARELEARKQAEEARSKAGAEARVRELEGKLRELEKYKEGNFTEQDAAKLAEELRRFMETPLKLGKPADPKQPPPPKP